MKIGTIFVWKHQRYFKACFSFSSGIRSYIIINDQYKTNEQINKRIAEWKIIGYKIVIGLPPPPKKG
jgi:hypothetical protein